MKWFLLCLLIPTIAFAQEETPEVIGYSHPEPEFIGGHLELIKYINENIEYPQEAIEKEIEGKVYARFFVESDGSISDIKIVRSVHPSLDTEVIRLISNMPNWKPIIFQGQPRRSPVSLPIVFTLEDALEED